MVKIGDKVKVKGYTPEYMVGSVEDRDGMYDLALYSVDARDMLEVIVPVEDVEIL